MLKYKPKRLTADEAREIINCILNGDPGAAERLIVDLTEDGIRDLHQIGSLIRSGTEAELMRRDDRVRRITSARRVGR